VIFSMKRTLAIALSVSAVVACHDEKTGTVAGPPLTIAPSSTLSPSSTPSPADGPLRARFLDLSSHPAIPVGVCQLVMVNVAKGTAMVADEKLSAGDILTAVGEGGAASADLAASGDGTVLVATARIVPCEGGLEAGRGVPGPGMLRKRVVRGSVAPELTWAGGAMHAHLDLDDRDVAPSAYMGRLEGTASVAEHTHPESWEVLAALEASGTFTLAGKEMRLEPKQIVVVPPDTKHAWRPDPGSKLVAIQMYAPPGPEQRFKKLAAEASGTRSDAGASDASMR
jgi:mannose-6-phosphate isomerase-like protein (cupin superfamily)